MYNYGVYEGCLDVIQLIINRESMIIGIGSWKALRAAWQHQLIIELSATFVNKMVAITMLLCPKNDRQWNVNNLWPCILENPRDVR
jgi:hypothetical protein